MPDDMSNIEQGTLGPEDFESAGKVSSSEHKGAPKGSFWDLQQRLENTKEGKEKTELLSKRNEMVSKAAKAGLFNDSKISLTGLIKNSTWDTVYSDVQKQSQNLEKSAKKFYGQNPEWEGMIESVVEGAAAKILLKGLEEKYKSVGGPPPSHWQNSEWMNSHGYDPELVSHLQQEAYLKFFYPIVPENPVSLVGSNLNKLSDDSGQAIDRSAKYSVSQMRELEERIRQLEESIRQTPQGQGNIANQLREALGYLPPAENMRAYLEAEEHMVGFNIGPGNEPRFFAAIDRQVRSEWSARATLTRIAGYKRAVPSYDKLFPNQDAIDLTKSELRHLLEKGEVFAASSLYWRMIENDLDPRKILLGTTDLNNTQIKDKLSSIVASSGMSRQEQDEYLETFLEKVKSCPNSIFEIKDGAQLSGLRTAMRFWLMTNRDSILDFKPNLPIPIDAARDEEQISWLMIYSSGIIEEKDSRFTEVGKKHDRLPPIAGLKSLPLWMIMHPQERLEAKITGTIPEEFGEFGTWALNKKNKLISRLSRWTPAREEILPTSLIGNIFSEIKLGEQGRYKTLASALSDNGAVLVTNPRADVSIGDLGALREAPFSGYQFDKLNPAILIFKVIVDGAQNDKSIVDLGDACRKLKVNNIYRDHFLMAWNGISSTSGDLKPAMGWGDYRNYKEQLKKYAPLYFK